MYRYRVWIPVGRKESVFISYFLICDEESCKSFYEAFLLSELQSRMVYVKNVGAGNSEVDPAENMQNGSGLPACFLVSVTANLIKQTLPKNYFGICSFDSA